jgi:hypothetical protein
MPDSGYRTAIDPLPACDGVRKPIDPMLSATAGPARSAPVTGTSTRHGRMMQGSGSMELHRAPSRRAARRPAAWLLCLVYALQSDCSTLPLHKPQTGHQTGLGRVAIVSPDREPEVKFQGLIGKATDAGGTFKTAWEPSGAAAAAAVRSAVPFFCSCWAFAASRGDRRCGCLTGSRNGARCRSATCGADRRGRGQDHPGHPARAGDRMGTSTFLASEWLPPPSEFSYRFETP